MQMQNFSVGSPIPNYKPGGDGATMEIGFPSAGWNVVVQFRNMLKSELTAFKSPLLSYAYYESPGEIPIAYWVFQFRQNISLETSFSAGIASQSKEHLQALNDFLAPIEGQLRNALNFYIMDGAILKTMKLLGVHPEAVASFHKTIHKQLAQDASVQDINMAISHIAATMDISDIYKAGQRFSPLIVSEFKQNIVH